MAVPSSLITALALAFALSLLYLSPAVRADAGRECDGRCIAWDQKNGCVVFDALPILRRRGSYAQQNYGALDAASARTSNRGLFPSCRDETNSIDTHRDRDAGTQRSRHGERATTCFRTFSCHFPS